MVMLFLESQISILAKQGRMEELFKGVEEGQKMVQTSLHSGYVAKNKNILVLKCEEQDTML